MLPISLSPHRLISLSPCRPLYGILSASAAQARSQGGAQPTGPASDDAQ